MGDKQPEDKRGKEWKDFLLKSSLPIEQLVSDKLEEKGLSIAGEYSYIRPNEQNINTEFSIDLHAYAPYRKNDENDKNLNFLSRLLVECKYNYPGVKWVFSPSSRGIVQPLLIPYIKKWTQQTGLNLYLPSCTRGIELNTSGFDPNTISRGLNQLRYGLPNLIMQDLKYLEQSQSYGSSLIISILVTTASLYILKSHQDIEMYRSAESLEDVANKVDTLLVVQEMGPHLQNYCEGFLEPLRSNIKTMSSEARKEYKEFKEKQLKAFFPKQSQIIVTHLDAFDNLLDNIHAALTKKMNKREKI